MPVLSMFPGGSGSGGGLALGAVSNIATLAASGKVYIKWTDPNDWIVDGTTLAAWDGTLLVRKAGSTPKSRRDGTIVLDSTTRDAYKSSYFCDSGLSDGTTYYYKFFPYTTTGTYTDSTDDEFNATPTAQVTGIDNWNVTGMSASTEAGDGKMTVKWTDPAATITSDGVTLATWAATTIVVKAGSYATSKDDSSAAYKLKTTTRNQYSGTALTVTGLTNGTTYYLSFFPETTDGGVNSSTSQRTTGIANRITISTVPSQSGSLTYTGNTQSPSWSNYNSSQLTLGGTTSSINAGTYSATFTPKTDYRWSDGSTSAKTVSWSIGKAAGSLTLSATSVTLNSTTTSATVTVTRAGDGAISASSNNTGVATVSVSGTTLTISSVNSTTGTATITVNVAAGTNYGSVSKTIAVTGAFVSTVLNDNSWETISGVAQKGEGRNYWAVGDCKAITLNGTVGTLSISNATYYVYILGFNHLDSIGIDFGTFKTAATSGVDVCLVDSYYTSYQSYDGTKYFQMNHWGTSSNYNTNYGGWKGCDMRYDILGSTNQAPSGYGSQATTSRVGYDATTTCATNPVSNTLMAALPSDLRAVMQPMTIYTDSVGNSSNVAANVTASVDYLPLLAEFEIFGSRSYANQYEQNSQQQYEYYSSGNSKVKYKHSSSGTSAGWWERSAYCIGADNFCFVRRDGNADYYIASRSYGLAPAFRV